MHCSFHGEIQLFFSFSRLLLTYLMCVFLCSESTTKTHVFQIVVTLYMQDLFTTVLYSDQNNLTSEYIYIYIN